MSKIKYSKELLEEVVKDCFSYQQVMRKLGLKISGGSSSHLKSRFIFYNIDISHFTGKASNRGINHKGGQKKHSPEDRFVLDKYDGRRDNGTIIKKLLIESGIEEKCSICELKPLWQNKKLVLQLDHIDGNGLDNRKDNLRFLCPNCHSQTETFCSKNAIYAPKIEKIKFSDTNPNWRRIPRPNIRKVERPSKEILEQLLWEKPSIKIAIDFGVSGKSIENWAKSYGITKPPRGYWSKLRKK